MNNKKMHHRTQISERIRYMREDANMSYAELSEKTGISIDHLEQWETTECGTLPAVEVAFLCEVFPISPNTLYTDMEFEEFKEFYNPLKDFHKLPPEFQSALIDTIKELHNKTHTMEEFAETLMAKVKAMPNIDLKHLEKIIEKILADNDSE